MKIRHSLVSAKSGRPRRGKMNHKSKKARRGFYEMKIVQWVAEDWDEAHKIHAFS